MGWWSLPLMQTTARAASCLYSGEFKLSLTTLQICFTSPPTCLNTLHFFVFFSKTLWFLGQSLVWQCFTQGIFVLVLKWSPTPSSGTPPLTGSTSTPPIASRSHLNVVLCLCLLQARVWPAKSRRRDCQNCWTGGWVCHKVAWHSSACDWNWIEI